MINQRFLLPVIAVLLWGYGCVQPIHNGPFLTDDEASPYEDTDSGPEVSDPVNSGADRTSPANIVSESERIYRPQDYPKSTAAIPSARIVEESISSRRKKKDRTGDKSPNGAKNIQQVMDEALDFCQVSQDLWQKGELENALEALDQAYSLILSITNHDEDPKLVQQKEDLRFSIAKRILEIYASRNIVVNGDHRAIPVVINRHVQREIDLFTKGIERNFFIRSYIRSGKYRPAIVSALTKAGIPKELSWLPLIESGFKTNALSRARALGLWQFIPSTGYKFGLKRNTFIDERLDPVKSTNAAIAYLNELHQIFGDWTTVLAAYNCGEKRVLHVIRSQNVNYLDNFWDLYARLPGETARYVPRFLATLHVINNLETYGLDSVIPDPPLEYETVSISRQVHLKDIAEETGMSEKILRELNPELRYEILPGDSYGLRVPPGTRDRVIAKIDKLPSTSRPGPAYVYHRIIRGETLSTIAKRYGTSVSRIARANNIYRSGRIIAGKRLKIPVRGSVKYTARRPKKSAEPPQQKPSTHVVRSGENLWYIAKRYGTTTKKIQQLNNLSSTRLHIGQRLKISAQASKPIDAEGLTLYPVKRGDSPFTIARRHNMSLERFLRINRLTPRSKIYPGQKLYVE